MKKFITVLLAVLFCFVAASCGEKKKGDVVISGNGYCVTDNGIYHINRDNMCFSDFATGYEVVLCNKPECNHAPYNRETNPLPSCASVAMADEILFDVVVGGEKMYWINSGAGDSPNISIYESNLDGSGKRLIAQIDGFVMINYLPTVYMEGKLFLHQRSFESWDAATNSENEREYIRCVDIASGKVKTVIDIEADEYFNAVDSMTAWGGKLYFTLNKNVYKQLEKGLELVEIDQTVYEVDGGTLEKKFLFENDGIMRSVYGFTSKGEIIYVESNGEQRKLLKGKGKALLDIFNSGRAFIDSYDDKIIYVDYNEGDDGYSVIDIATGETVTEISCDSKIIAGFTDELVVARDIVDGRFFYMAAKKNELYNGIINWFSMN